MKTLVKSCATYLVSAGVYAVSMLLFLPHNVFSQTPKNTTIQDSAVIFGRLPNGFSYYIRKNAKPEKRAEMRLVVDVGSIYEDDDQQGLAHVLEHLAFNGTKNFPKRELVGFLESVGMTFGAHTNAYTSCEETVYQLQIPTNDTSVIRKGVQILHDWAENIRFDTLETNKERGVVVEEWRLQEQGVAGRLRRQTLPILWEGLIHQTRLPIGKKAIIDTFRLQRVRDFYETWYRPSRMAAIVVGDIDPRRIEFLIKTHFAGMQARTTEQAFIPPQSMKQRSEPQIAVLLDKEIPASATELIWKHEIPVRPDSASRRHEVLRAVLVNLMNNRFTDIVRNNPTHPINRAVLQTATQTRLLKTITLNVEAKLAVVSGFSAALAEIERVLRFGFLEAEIQRLQRSLIEGTEQQYKQRENTTSAVYAEIYVAHALGQGAVRSAAEQCRLDKAILQSLTSAEIHAFAREMLRDSNQVILCAYPDREGMRVPEKQEFLDVVKSVRALELAPYRETFVDAPFLEHEPRAGKIVRTETVKSLGITKWTLSNGASVILKPTTWNKEEILMQCFAAGGYSERVTPENFMDLTETDDIQSPLTSGVGTLSAADIEKKLAGISATLAPEITRSFHGFKGSTRLADIKTYVQFLHAACTRPRLDTAIIQAQRFSKGLAAQNRGADPESVLTDSAWYNFHNYHFIAKPSTKADFDAWNHAGVGFPFYKQRFANANGMTFVFVGGFKEQDMKPFVEQYIASLPSSLQEKTRWKDMEIRYAKGIRREVYAGVDAKSVAMVMWGDTCTWSPEKDAVMRVANDILQTSLSESLREDSSGVYYVYNAVEMSRIPHEEYTATLYFPCAPDRARQLTAQMYTVLENLANARFPDRYLDDAKAKLLATHETDLRTNSFWQTTLVEMAQHLDKPSLLLDFTKRINAVKKTDVAALIRVWLKKENAVEFILLPEKTLTEKKEAAQKE